VRTWAWVVLALLAAHDLTHAVDGGLDTGLGELALVSIPQWLLLAAVMSIVLRGDPARSRTAALVLGAAVAAGFVVVHLLPFSPAAYWDLDPSPASWALAWIPIAAGLALAAQALSRSG
jgi:hypothetical protein